MVRGLIYKLVKQGSSLLNNKKIGKTQFYKKQNFRISQYYCRDKEYN
jgi:hypothetical protein